MRTIIVIAGAHSPARRLRQLDAAGGKLGVVAAENVYGEHRRADRRLARLGHVDPPDPNADPHLFEPGTSNGARCGDGEGRDRRTALGYDAFMTRLENAAPSERRIVVTIADVLGVHGKDANPHLWYDVPRLDRVAARDRRRASRARTRARGARIAAASRRFEREPRAAAARGRERSARASAARRSRTPSRSPATWSPRPGCGTSRRTRSRARSRTEPSRPPRPSRR